MRVICGDIGGTKTRLAVIEVAGDRLQVEREQTFASGDFATLEGLLSEFTKDSDMPRRAAFGIAGPVAANEASTTNLPWHIKSDSLIGKFGFKSCLLLNDLEATAAGIPALHSTDLLVLHAGNPDASGNAAVIAAGTGLGEAGLFWDGQRYHPFATEGGHASFSPGSEIEIALLQFLQMRYGQVSWERVVSGQGLVNLYEFFCHHHGATEPDWLEFEKREGDAAASIAQAARNESDALCTEAFALFVRLYGAEAGNFALKIMSRGGVYLGGGIAPKIVPALQQGDFLDSFFNKGRMKPLLQAMPVTVILNDRAALYGAALQAAQA